MKTQIIALGTGSAFTMKNYQTNLIIERNNKRLLIDCGGDIRFSLRDQNLTFADINAVYISHAHAEHIGGLEFLGFTRYFTKKGMEQAGHSNPLPLPKLFCERGLIRSLWDHSLRGGMEGLEGIEATIDTYFFVNPISKNGFFIWEGLKFDMVQSLHVSAKYSIIDSFGLMFSDEDGTRIFMKNRGKETHSGPLVRMALRAKACPVGGIARPLCYFPFQNFYAYPNILLCT